MLDVKNLATLLGKQVKDQNGNIGEIIIIDYKETNYPIKVDFGKGHDMWFTANGILAGCGVSNHITLIDELESAESDSLEATIAETMLKYKVTPEELISVILGNYC
jgi:hypothetical protein